MEKCKGDDIPEVFSFEENCNCESIDDVSQASERAQNTKKACIDFVYNVLPNPLESNESTFQYIDKIMYTWNQLPQIHDWTYDIQFISKIDTDSMEYSAFEVKWSKPVIGYTYPMIAVNVYIFLKVFSEEFNHVVEMKYRIEGYRFVYDTQEPINPHLLIGAYEDKKKATEIFQF